MPLLGFTLLKSKLLDGSKLQTIRKPRKHPIKVGDTLHIFWKLRTKQCERLGEAVVTKIVRKKADNLTEEDAVKDGFSKTREGLYLDYPARTHLLTDLVKMHPNVDGETEFDVISFRWTLKLWEKNKP